MAASAPRPRPRATLDSEPYWQSLRDGALQVQECTACGTRRLYPSPICRDCHSFEHRWVAVSGSGRVRSYCVTHRIGHPAFAELAPFVTVDVELEEGVRLSGMLLDAPPGAVAVGMPVRLDYAVVDAELTLPAFRPAPV